jgi:hypothetical protein
MQPMDLCFTIVSRSHVASDEKHKWTVEQHKRTKDVTMSSEPKFDITYFDTKTERLALLKGKDFADQLDRLKRAIEYVGEDAWLE